jgi:Adenine-specific methyltransferase EcoRI
VTEPTKTRYHRNLADAKTAKADEFYTQLADIERELKHYRRHFKGKVVYCNADDPRISNFFHYFSHNFERVGLKRLITTCYQSEERDRFSKGDSEHAIYLEYAGDRSGNRVPDPDEIGVHHLEGDGDFRSAECLELLKQADVAVTNPPFSLLREYVAQLVEHDKKFVILGNKNAVTYAEIFPLIQANRLWVGHTPMGTEMLFDVTEEFGRELVASGKDRKYTITDGVVRARAQACWFTNLDFAKRHEDLILYKRYSSEEYPTYDNYDAIEVSRVENIPLDYDGVMGVPITFLDKHNPAQFEILGIAKAPLGKPSKVYPQQVQVSASGVKSTVTKLNDGPAMKVDQAPAGKTYYEVDGETYVQLYARILIRRKEPTNA